MHSDAIFESNSTTSNNNFRHLIENIYLFNDADIFNSTIKVITQIEYRLLYLQYKNRPYRSNDQSKASINNYIHIFLGSIVLYNLIKSLTHIV